MRWLSGIDTPAVLLGLLPAGGSSFAFRPSVYPGFLCVSGLCVSGWLLRLALLGLCLASDIWLVPPTPPRLYSDYSLLDPLSRATYVSGYPILCQYLVYAHRAGIARPEFAIAVAVKPLGLSHVRA